jgi:hypothetical protein
MSRHLISRHLISRRRFLSLPLALLLAPVGRWSARAWAATSQARKGSYTADIGILYGLLTFRLEGVLSEATDRATGRYHVTIAGEGDGIANEIESSGLLRNGRWVPLEGHSWFSVKGRESRSELRYDWARRTVEYRFRGETFFLRRVRVADDRVSVPEGVHVDDSISASLNYADGVWPARADGSHETHIVRRKRADDEGLDDVQQLYRAELVPFTLKVDADPVSGKPVALFDLTRFSSWAKNGEPARVTFGRDRRPELMSMPLILGSSVKVELRSL